MRQRTGALVTLGIASALVLGIAFSGDVSSMSLDRARVAAPGPSPRPLVRPQPRDMRGEWARSSVEIAAT
jgi:hypothetical protein